MTMSRPLCIGAPLAPTLLAALIALSALTGGCASYSGSTLVAGKSTAAEVESTMGTPKEKLAGDGGESVWFYPRGPAGRQTFAVRIGADGIMRAIEQRLTTNNVARLTVGKTSAQEARALLGPPNFNRYMPRTQRHNWEYWMSEGEDGAQSPKDNYRLLTLEFSEDSVLRKVNLMNDFNDLSPGCMLC